jgi:hypothetical protein
MTRHNLKDHISWLLSQNIAFPSAPIPSNDEEQPLASHIDANLSDEEGRETHSASSRRSREQTIVGTIAPQQFTRPALPISKSRPPPRDTINSIETARMGKLVSAQRSTVPVLQSQRQLATPSSTTGSSVAPSRGTLYQGYSELLRSGNNGM